MATITVGAPAKAGELLSERIAPGILLRVLARFDMAVAVVVYLLGLNTARRALVAAGTSGAGVAS